MITLGIETSCDETALALIETQIVGDKKKCRVINSLVHSQAELHSAYGGVYPSLAKREHGKNIIPLFHKIVSSSDGYIIKTKEHITEPEFNSRLKEIPDNIASQNPELYSSFVGAEYLRTVLAIDQIAVTEGPGLEPALWVGINFARLISTVWQIPIVPIDHMEGHIVGSLLDPSVPYGAWQEIKEPPMPAIALLISGGHTEIVRVDNIGNYKIIGKTKDDAVGEAYDKVARLLNLPYPGGPHISRFANEALQQGITPKIKLPRPMINSDDIDFSFSGLKTAVLYAVRDATAKGEFDESYRKGLALEFENAVTDVLNIKTRTALESTQAKSIILGGGVSANTRIRTLLGTIAKEYNIPILLPSGHISGDNGLMIAVAAMFNQDIKNNTDVRATGNRKLDRKS